MTIISSNISQAVQFLRQGKLIGLPTETVYGLAADACSEAAVRNIFLTKGRPFGNPLIVHLCNENQIKDWAENIPKEVYLLTRHFWPGPLTLILKKKSHVLNL